MKNNTWSYLFKPRTLLLMSADALGLLCSHMISLIVAYSLQEASSIAIAARLEFDSPFNLFISSFSYIIFCLIFLAFFQVYRNILSFSLDSSLIRCVFGVGGGSIVATILNYYVLHNKTYNKLTAILSLAIGIIVICLERIVYQYINTRINISSKRLEGKRCLIIGAGFTGQTVLKELFHSKDKKYLPVCFVDDDPAKTARQISGIPVYGPVLLLPELCKKHNIESIIFAIPSCDEEKRQKILSLCSNTGCEVQVIPSLLELSTTVRFMPQSTTINVNNLLNRDVIHVDDSNYRQFITGKIIMVTGIGSIGSELCRQIVTFAPKQIVMLDIYENSAYEVQQELINKGYGDIISVEIASVRDYKKMEHIFSNYHPDVVFHAAAHKHVPLMEHNPEEAVKNNIVGTHNVAKLCKRFKVSKMVLISTDKAVNPTNVMGASKRCCEMIMQYMAQQKTNTDFAAVRFGNVLGSNGSVIPLFCNQIEAGGPVTVTHPDIIRYFMTIQEAVSLVLQAGAMAKGGEIFVLNMGEPVKIISLAENLIRMYGYEPYTEIPIKFVGLRPGEKLFEELLMSEENLTPTANKKIFIGNQININAEEIEKNLSAITKIADTNDKESVIEYLHKIVPTFKAGAVTQKK